MHPQRRVEYGDDDQHELMQDTHYRLVDAQRSLPDDGQVCLGQQLAGRHVCDHAVALGNQVAVQRLTEQQLHDALLYEPLVDAAGRKVDAVAATARSRGCGPHDGLPVRSGDVQHFLSMGEIRLQLRHDGEHYLLNHQ